MLAISFQKILKPAFSLQYATLGPSKRVFHTALEMIFCNNKNYFFKKSCTWAPAWLSWEDYAILDLGVLSWSPTQTQSVEIT